MAAVETTCCSRWTHRLTRKKTVDLSYVGDTQLNRCLTAFDLTALGIGATLGAGIYVVAGQVARSVAGPSVVISFLIAAFASVLAGLCYAEFGARVPKTGSAYVYSYVSVGELMAFIIGWNLILEYVIGTASVARAWSSYVDSLCGHKISTFLSTHLNMRISHMFSSYPDLFALTITLLLTVVLCIGVKESAILNNVFTAVNILVVLYVVLCGMFKFNFANWNIPENKVPPSTDPKEPNGVGGFFPFGVGGMLSGAATCFYAFVGFDCIATTGEEVRNPQKAIPIAIVLSLIACFLAYFGMSATLTLMVPYYTLDKDAPVPDVFSAVGWGTARYVIAVGAICGLSTSLLGGMFPMPRVIYAMASDGLIFRSLAYVNERFKTPIFATLFAGILAGIMAMMFDLQELVDMMSIGTLLAYTLVAVSVIILRFKVTPFTSVVTISTENSDIGSVNLANYPGKGTSESSTLIAERRLTFSVFIKHSFKPASDVPNAIGEKIIKYILIIMSLCMVSCSALLAYGLRYITGLKWWALTILVVLLLCILLCVIVIHRQIQNLNFTTFKVPAVTYVAPSSMFINIFLMMKLPAATWARFGIWLLIGFLIYFCYGIFHSSEEMRETITSDETKSESRDNSPLSQ